MNKKLLTAAIAAGLMVPGLASADVKIFGAIQAETGNVDVSISGAPDGDVTVTGNATGGDSGAIHGGGANALGVKGSEKLGNGLSAYFKLNWSFSTWDHGSNAFGARDSFVGLKGDGWHVQFGDMNSRYKAASVKYDPLLATGLQSRANGGMSALHNSYAENVGEIGFKSGAWSGGFQLKWEDSVGTTDAQNLGLAYGDTEDSGSWNMNVKYAANNWEAGFAYADYDYDNIAPAADGDADAWKIHGKYDFGNGLAVMAQYEDLDLDTGAAAGTNSLGGGAFVLGVAPATLGAAEEADALHIAVTYALSDATTLIGRFADSDADDIGGVNNANSEGTHWAIGATHSLSKRTTVYGGYMDNEYDNNATAGADVDVDAWGLGLLHKF